MKYILSWKTVIAVYITIFGVQSQCWAADPSIDACYGKEHGQLRIVKPSEQCLPSELPISLSAGQSGPHIIAVDCDNGEKIQDAVDRASRGTTILASGICMEEIIIRTEQEYITIDGQGTAVIDASDGLKGAVNTAARYITIRGFTIYGGGDVAVRLAGGAIAFVEDNYIANATNEGIAVRRGSIATITGNTISNNGGPGIQLFGNSQARIGFGNNIIGPNVIKHNGGDGVSIGQSSHAWVVESSIHDNLGSGVSVWGVSNAHISANSINGNAGHGVKVDENSNVFLGSTIDGGTFGSRNESSVNNGRFGVRCKTNSSAVGGVGTLNGSNGAKYFDESCVDRLL